MKFIPEKYLVTAGGKIKCIRCKAYLKKHQRQCLHPALKNKTCCKWHGGMSTGPKTKEGIERIRQAHLTTGNQTLAAKEQKSEQSLKLALLEDMMHVLKMTNSSKSRGPKPKGYKRLTSIEDIKKQLVDLT
jgi:hypothetical protein